MIAKHLAISKQVILSLSLSFARPNLRLLHIFPRLLNIVCCLKQTPRSRTISGAQHQRFPPAVQRSGRLRRQSDVVRGLRLNLTHRFLRIRPASEYQAGSSCPLLPLQCDGSLWRKGALPGFCRQTEFSCALLEYARGSLTQALCFF